MVEAFVSNLCSSVIDTGLLETRLPADPGRFTNDSGIGGGFGSCSSAANVHSGPTQDFLTAEVLSADDPCCKVSNDGFGLNAAPLIDLRFGFRGCVLRWLPAAGLIDCLDGDGLSLMPLIDGARKDSVDAVDIIVMRLSARLVLKLTLIGDGTDSMLGDGT